MRDNLKWVEGLPIIIGTGGKARWMPYGAGRAVAMDARLLGVLFWGAVAAAVYCLRPNAVLNRTDMEICGRREMLVMAGLALATVLVWILPMSLSPYWNGEFPQHRNQYEVMAESLLNGHIYMDYDDIDPRLLEMDKVWRSWEWSTTGTTLFIMGATICILGWCQYCWCSSLSG